MGRVCVFGSNDSTSRTAFLGCFVTFVDAPSYFRHGGKVLYSLLSFFFACISSTS